MCCACFRVLTIYLAPILPATAERVARELFGMDRPFAWSDLTATPDHIAPYKHLMTRVETKQIDALFEAPASGRAGQAPAGWRCHRRHHHDRRLRQARLPHREDRHRVARRGQRQAAQADARRRRRARAHRLLGDQVRLQAGRPGWTSHGAGRKPCAAQDEVRRQRRHGACRQPRRREGQPRDLPARSESGRAARHARQVTLSAGRKPEAHARAEHVYIMAAHQRFT